MTDKVLSPATLSLISGAGLTSVLVWQIGSTDVTNVEHIDYIESQGTTVGLTIRNAVLADPDYVPEPNERDGTKKTWVWSVARNGNNQPNQALRRQNGTATSDCPYIVPFDCTIYAASCVHNANEGAGSTWNFQVDADGVNVYSLAMSTSSDEAFDDNVNVNLTQGQRITIFMRNQNQAINHPGGSIYLIEI